MARRRKSTLTQPIDVHEYAFCLFNSSHNKLKLYLEFSDDLRKERELLALPFSKSPFIDGEEAATDKSDVRACLMRHCCSTLISMYRNSQ